MATAEDILTPERRQPRGGSAALKEGRFGALSAQGNGFLLALYAISVTWPIKFQIGPLHITFSRIMLLALLLPMILRVLSGRYGGVKKSDVLVVAFALWAYVCMGVNHGFATVIESSGMFFVETVGAYFFGRVFLRSLQDFYIFVRYMMISIMISIPFGTIEMFTGEPFLLDLLRQVNPLPGIFTFVANVDYDPRLGLHRVQYTLQHPIFYGIMCASFVALCFTVMTRGEGFGKKTFWGGVVLYTTFMGLSSAGWLSALMQIGFLLYERFTRWFKPRWIIIFWAFVVAYIFLSIFASHNPFVFFATKFTLSPHTAWFRVVIYEFGWQNVMANPIFGIGNNDWARPHWLGSSVDSHWLLNSMRHGLPGALLLSLTVLFPVIAAGRAKTTRGTALNAFQIGYMCCMISWIVSLATVTINVEVVSLFMTVTAAGYMIADLAQQETGEIEDDPRGGRRASRRSAYRGREDHPTGSSNGDQRFAHARPERKYQTRKPQAEQSTGLKRNVPRRSRGKPQGRKER